MHSFLLLAVWIQASAAPAPLLYAPLDRGADAALVRLHVGLTPSGAAQFPLTRGMVGKAVRADQQPLEYDLSDFLTREQGAVAAWVRIPWNPAADATHMVFDLGRFGSLRRWRKQMYLTFTVWYHHIDEKHDYGCTASIAAWRPGQWRHLAITWSWPQRRRAIYIDGQLAKAAPIRRIPNVVTLFRVGPELSAVDELCVFDRELRADEVRRLYEAGRAGRPAFYLAAMPPVVPCAPRLPDAPRPKPPAFVNWSFKGAFQRDNGLRGEITLNGWWRWQRAKGRFDPPNPARWLYRKAPALSHYGQSFPLRDERFRIVKETDPRTGGTSRIKGAAVWCEREFVPPKSWRGRRLALDVDSVVAPGAIYFNGVLLEALPKISLGGTYDVTDAVRWDRPNRVTIRCRGVDGDLWLRSAPAAAAVEDAWLRTSFRKKRLDCDLVVRSDAPRAVEATVVVTDKDGRREVKRLSGRARLRRGATRFTVGAAWTPPNLWSLEHPNLYAFSVELRDIAGRLLDKTLPQRFGFRELWIERDRFLLNGKPVYFIGHSNAHLTSSAELACEPYVRYSLARWKAAGLNCITPWQGPGRNPTLSHLLDVSDEMGVAIFVVNGLPSFERVKYLSDAVRKEYAAYYRRYITRYRQHPSLLGWMVGSGAHVFDFCPSAMNGRFDPEKLPGFDRGERLRMGWDLAARFDPTRIKFGLSEGAMGPVWTSMAYQGFDVDLRERENWPWTWSRVRNKPLMPCEFSLPYYRDWFMRTQRRTGSAQYRPKGTHALATEYAAMFFGEAAYAWDDEDYLRSLAQSPGAPAKAKSFWETKKLFADTLRAWRTYGISFIYHAEVPAFFTGPRPTFPLHPDADPRRPGGAPESLHGSLQAADKLSEFGERVRKATAPVLAFVAAPPPDFTYSDHTYFAGERVRKAAVVLNYREEPLRYRLAWRVRSAAGRVVASGASEGRLPPGGRSLEAARIEFLAPPATRREDLRIELTCEGDARLADSFAITIFPRPASAPRAEPMLFDPAGDTRRALAALRVRAQPMPAKLPGDGLLVIGRHALETPAHRAALQAAGFDAAVARGLRVLVFEQAASGFEGDVMGLRLRRTETRRAFPRAPGHPALRGLKPGDFFFFRGDSDLIPAHPDPGPMPSQYPLHFWHWGNDNIVATYVLERPQVGAAAALLDCGFDLSETPLLEVARGKGTMVFCQLDVTNRCGRDPVATRLVTNLLEYLARLGPQERRGADPAALARRRRAKGTVRLFRSRAPEVAGVNDGDMFFRRRLTLPAFDRASPTPLFARVGDGWTTSLFLKRLPTPWLRAKLARVAAALRLANRAPALTGPQLRLQGRPDALYPHDWRRVESLGGRFDPYVFWRW